MEKYKTYGHQHAEEEDWQLDPDKPGGESYPCFKWHSSSTGKWPQ